MTKPTSKVIKKIDIGGGEAPKEGYLNVDLYDLNADVKDDIRTLKKFDDHSVDEINASHILEHLSPEDVIKALNSMHRVLVPKGKVFIEVPDLEWILQDWLDTPENDRWGWKLQTIFGLQKPENPIGELHKTGFTQRRLGILLSEANFHNIKIEVIKQEDSPHNQQVIRAEVTKL
jgi:predicted SAM-dependent methyltransferase